MLRCVEVNIDTEAGEARCAVCGSPMDPFVGWDIGTPEWVSVWWRCRNDQTHISSALPLPRDLMPAHV